MQRKQYANSTVIMFSSVY